MTQSPKVICIAHKLGGGLATARGNGIDDPPAGTFAGNAEMRIPFLTRAENIDYTLNGGWKKKGGTSKYNATEIASGAAIRGMYEYVRQGTSGSPDRFMVCHAGTAVYADANDGSFSSIFTGLTADTVPNYSQFDDTLIIASDGDSPRKWDGTTPALLGGSPPDFSFATQHANKLFAAGVDANSSTLYYSDTGDAENWSTADSGSLEVSPGDGDRITAIYSFMQRLIIFKGPVNGSVHVLSGLVSDDFELTTIARGVGAAGPNLVFPFGTDIGYVSQDGSIRTFQTTDRFGDFIIGSLSEDIDNPGGVTSTITTSFLNRGSAATIPQLGVVAFALPVHGNATPNLWMEMDYRFIRAEGKARFATQTMTEPYCVVKRSNPANANRDELYLGGSDGFIRRANTGNFNIDGGATAIECRVRYPFMSYGQPSFSKTLNAVGAGIVAKGSYTSAITWIRDQQSQQSATINQVAAAPLDVFELDADTLSGADYGHRFAETPEGGEFRYISFGIDETTVDQGIEVHALDSVVTMDMQPNLEDPT